MICRDNLLQNKEFHKSLEQQWQRCVNLFCCFRFLTCGIEVLHASFFSNFVREKYCYLRLDFIILSSTIYFITVLDLCFMPLVRWHWYFYVFHKACFVILSCHCISLTKVILKILCMSYVWHKSQDEEYLLCNWYENVHQKCIIDMNTHPRCLFIYF